MAGVGTDPSTQGASWAFRTSSTTPGWTTTRIGPDRYDSPEMAAEVDHQARPEGLTRQARSGPSSVQRDLVFSRVTDQSGHVFAVPGHDHAQRVDLVKAGVVGVGRPLDRLEQKFAAENASKIVVNPGPLLVHGEVASWESNRSWTRRLEGTRPRIERHDRPYKSGQPTRRGSPSHERGFPIPQDTASPLDPEDHAAGRDRIGGPVAFEGGPEERV